MSYVYPSTRIKEKMRAMGLREGDAVTDLGSEDERQVESVMAGRKAEMRRIERDDLWDVSPASKATDFYIGIWHEFGVENPMKILGRLKPNRGTIVTLPTIRSADLRHVGEDRLVMARELIERGFQIEDGEKYLLAWRAN